MTFFAYLSKFWFTLQHYAYMYNTSSLLLHFLIISDPTAAILREAMKDGYIPHKDDLFLIHGPGGVGKSSLISMFLGKQRDLARVSTAVPSEMCQPQPSLISGNWWTSTVRQTWLPTPVDTFSLVKVFRE